MGRPGVVQAVARRFCAGGGDIDVHRHNRGHIHESWFVAGRYGNVLLQRLNDRVFPDCVQMTDNVVRVVSHLHRKVTKRRLPDAERRVLAPLRADGGGVVVYDEDKRPWRAFRFVDGSVSQEVVNAPETAYQLGWALGRFLDDIQDLPNGRRLPEVIPGFKDFRRRRDDFEFVVEVDAFGRVATCRDEIEAVRSHHRLAKYLERVRGEGRLPARIVHNDAKASNVLLDAETGEALCVIDLDTVGLGSVLFDVGDLLRSAAVSRPEDAGDDAPVQVRDDLLEAVLDGYLHEAGPVLSDEELDLLPLAGPLMAYESALRFLSDYLVGDSYFRTDRPGHNLDRARTQLAVVDELYEAADRVAELVDRHAG